MTQIKNFVVGNEFTGFYLAKQLETKQTNATPPKDYFDIVLADATGEISAKFWDATPTDKETFFPMDLIKVQGIVQTYKEKHQVKITRMRKTTPEDGVSITDFVRSAPVQAVDLVYSIKKAVESIQDDKVRQIVEWCVFRVEEKLMSCPAAKTMHHAYFGGLAYHISRMLELGEFICKQRPFLNPDLIKAGIILHDIAKTEEMTAEFGVVKEYSLTGRLMGHISIASTWITEAAIILSIGPGSEKVIALQHMVLSHHNLVEWGSPVQPQMPEAVALHYIDQLDAKLQMVEDALDITPEAEPWTQPIRGLENKAIYRMKL